MPFRFRFKSLLQQREYLLREAQSALALAHYRRKEIQDRIEQMRERRRSEWHLWEEGQKGGMEAFRYLSFRNYLEFLEQQLLLLEAELNKASDEVSVRQGVVAERDKDVKMLEDLREKDREAHRYLQGKIEQKQLDETAVFKDFRERIEQEKEEHEA